MIDTFSKFYYGHNITRNNRFLNFDEGGGELTAELAPSSYTLTEFLVAVQSALNSVGTLNYVVSVDRASRLISISGDANFSLLAGTGSQIGQGVWSLLGFSSTDRTGAAAYTGDLASGSEYRPQYKLQDYVDSSIFEQSVSEVINKTTEGNIEVVSFGRENFFEMNILYITNNPGFGIHHLTNPTGLEDAIDFLQDITNKRRFEFMPDVAQSDSFSKVILESTPSSSNGVGFKLRERFTEGLRDYYDTGLLKLRVVT